MNAADRELLAGLADVAARFVMPPRPHIDRALPSADYITAAERAERQFAELQRERAINLATDMQWLASKEEPLSLEDRIEITTKHITEDLAKPLPYPVKAEVPA